MQDKYYLLDIIFNWVIYGFPLADTDPEETDSFTQAHKQDCRAVNVHCPHCAQTFDYLVRKEKINDFLTGKETKIITTCRYCKKPLIGRLSDREHMKNLLKTDPPD
ncbi:MAG: hypothetical protein AB7S78_02705 [Candidatus Omnitrophota bacterium]